MSLSSVKPVNQSGVGLQTDGNKIVISGNIEVENPSTIMAPFFQEVHQAILESNTKSVEVDITNLNHLNSSGIREIVEWVMKLDEVPKEKKYNIKFLCNSKILWQDNSITTIEFLNKEFISKEFVV